MPSRRLPTPATRCRPTRFAANAGVWFTAPLLLSLMMLIEPTRAMAQGLAPGVAQETAPPATTRVLIIRGVLNIFSTGLDELGKELRQRGYEVEVSSPGGCWGGALRLREAYERDPRGGPLVIIGHSMGGRACLHISRYLESHHIPVKLVVIVDANPWVACPANVERCVNLYVTNPYGVFHGSPVQGPSSRVLNYDVTKIERPAWADPVDHFDIDNSPWMHGVIIGEVERAYAPWRAASHAPRWNGPAPSSAASSAPVFGRTETAPADVPGRVSPAAAFSSAGFRSVGEHSPAPPSEPTRGLAPPAPRAPRPLTEIAPADPGPPRPPIRFRL
jgi:hypothetical protein